MYDIIRRVSGIAILCEVKPSIRMYTHLEGNKILPRYARMGGCVYMRQRT